LFTERSLINLKKIQLILVCFVLAYSITPYSFAEVKKPTWIAEFTEKDVDLSGLDKKAAGTVLNALNKNKAISGCKRAIIMDSCGRQAPKCCYNSIFLKEIVTQAKQGKSEEYLLGLLSGYSLYEKVKRAVAEAEAKRIWPVKPGNSPWKGAEDAPITIVEFFDFQCPYCIRANSTIKQIFKVYPNKIKLYLKNKILPFHKNATNAALASLAAHKQGKFWEMRDILFKNSKTLTKENILKYAEEIGLKMEQFKKDMDSKELKDQVKADMAHAKELAVSGIPTFFINGRKIRGARPFNDFKKVIDEELAKLKAKPAS
jgi:predicted DsbA family dithiol-disulfide isomerase